jgi:hypothetical protein
MKEQSTYIKIPLDFIEANLELYVYGNRKEVTLYTIDKQIAFENGMSPYQILEGNFYNYYFNIILLFYIFINFLNYKIRFLIVINHIIILFNF